MKLWQRHIISPKTVDVYPLRRHVYVLTTIHNRDFHRAEPTRFLHNNISIEPDRHQHSFCHFFRFSFTIFGLLVRFVNSFSLLLILLRLRWQRCFPTRPRRRHRRRLRPRSLWIIIRLLFLLWIPGAPTTLLTPLMPRISPSSIALLLFLARRGSRILRLGSEHLFLSVFLSMRLN